MRHLIQLAEQVRQWAEREDRVRALLWYGTQALGTWTPFSDVDAAIVHRGGAREVVDSLRQCLGERVRECVHLDGRGEAALWVDEALTKIDLRLVLEPSQLHGMATAWDVPAPRFVPVLDKDMACAAIVRAAAVRHARDLTAVIDEELEKFLVGFEAASNAHRRSDGYRFYFEYNLALHRLARLVELARGSGEYLFLPRMLLSMRLGPREQVAFRDLHGVLYLPQAAEQKQRLADAFLKIVRELAAKVPLRRSADSMAGFLAAVLDRDSFFNVRDFSGAFPGLVQPGRLFRASALSRLAGTAALDGWLVRERVVKVVDFRDPEEAAAKLPYPADLAARLQVVSLPLSGRPEVVGEARSPGETYYQHFRAHIDSVVAALRIVAEPRDGAVAVHCHAGKDRTGWFCATVGLLLGLEVDLVVDDYLRSGQDTSEASIRAFLRLVAAAGGVQEILAAAGYDHADAAALRRRLLVAGDVGIRGL